MNISVDGFMAGIDGGLDWHFEKWDSTTAEALCEQLNRADTILLGRNTYNAMAQYWPAVSAYTCTPRDDIAFAMMMNNHQKVVVSKAPGRLSWNNSAVIKGNIAQEIAKLKKQPGKDIILFGSGSLVSLLLQKGLIDSYALWVHPVILGKGAPLFKSLLNRENMKLSALRQFKSGVVVFYYDKV
jgi:dihydrofolate reductase